MKKKSQSVLSLTTLAVALVGLWKATGAGWIVWLLVVVAAVEAAVYLKK